AATVRLRSRPPPPGKQTVSCLAAPQTGDRGDAVEQDDRQEDRVRGDRSGGEEMQAGAAGLARLLGGLVAVAGIPRAGEDGDRGRPGDDHERTGGGRERRLPKIVRDPPLRTGGAALGLCDP